jgi:leucyl aminopeptidase
MSLHLTLTSPASFSGLTVVPTPAPETVTFETAGKEVGDIRLLNGKAVLSLGPQVKINAEMIRRAGGMLAKWLAKHEVRSAGLELAPLFGFGLTPEAALGALVEGLLLGNFKFDNYKSDKKNLDITLNLFVEGETASLQKAVEKATIVSESVNLAREWSHEPGNVINPVTLAERVQKLAAEVGLKCTVLDDQQLEAMGAGAIVAVGKASATPSRLILLEYTGTTNEQPVALVGKALTFDTGGYSLKPSEGISTMKYDKSGGMAVIATLVAAARLNLATPVVGVIASAENMISGHGYRPDDILTALNGKTIEVLNTDAEGRLILADALTYTERTFKPRAMIDIATLTGAVLIALGTVRAGVLGNSGALAQSLLQAGERTFERLWQLPLDQEYFDQIKGDDSDIKNSGGRKAGTIIGAMFLKQFVTDATAWAHIDMAGMMNAEKDLPYCPKGGMGFGVRLFIDYLENL